MKRLLVRVVKDYCWHILVVILCIFGSAFVTVRGTLFLRSLIDDYVVPLIGAAHPDFSPLAGALLRLAALYFIGVFLAYCNSRIMILVGQGTIRKLRNELFSHMQSLPVRYLAQARTDGRFR